MSGDDVVWVRATMNFGDVERGDVFSLSPERAIALGHYVEPVDLETWDPPSGELGGAEVSMELGEHAVEFAEEDADGPGGRLPAED